jgi:hypothetical protein
MSSCPSAVFAIFSPRSPPSRATGVAAPISVPGAIASRCAEYPMNTPALAAWAPEGPTQTTTGTWLSRMAVVIRVIDSPRPPGVSSWSTTTSAPEAFASAITSVT